MLGAPSSAGVRVLLAQEVDSSDSRGSMGSAELSAGAHAATIADMPAAVMARAW